MTMYRAAGFIFCFVLSGCMETAAQRDATRMRAETNVSATSATECYGAAVGKPEYAGLRQHSYFNADQNWPLQMLNDQTLPIKDDIIEIYRMYSDMQVCRQIILGSVPD